MDKVLVKLYLPVIENEYDVYVERAVKTKNNNYIVKAYENLYTFKDDISEITQLDIDLDMDEYITSQILISFTFPVALSEK